MLLTVCLRFHFPLASPSSPHCLASLLCVCAADPFLTIHAAFKAPSYALHFTLLMFSNNNDMRLEPVSELLPFSQGVHKCTVVTLHTFNTQNDRIIPAPGSSSQVEVYL